MDRLIIGFLTLDYIFLSFTVKYHDGTNFLSFQKTLKSVFDAPLLRLFCEGFGIFL